MLLIMPPFTGNIAFVLFARLFFVHISECVWAKEFIFSRLISAEFRIHIMRVFSCTPRPKAVLLMHFFFFVRLRFHFRNIVGGSGFSGRFGELIGRCGRVGYGLGIVQRAACLVVGPVVVDGLTSLFGCAAVVRASVSVAASSWGFNQ